MAVFVCPNCSHTQEAPDEYIGRTAKCLKCEAKGEITAAKMPPAAPSPPPPPPPKKKEPQPVPTPPTISTLQGNVIIALLAAMLGAQILGLTSTKTSATEWEYTIQSPRDSLFELEMSDLGNKGWELVFARRATSEYGPPSYEMILKRPKQLSTN